MNLFDKQIQIIEYVKKYLKKAENENIITSLSGFCYFPIWSETPGHAKIKFWLNGWLFSFTPQCTHIPVPVVVPS